MMKFQELDRGQGTYGQPDERQWKIIERSLALTKRDHPTMEKNLCDGCFGSRDERDIQREYRTWLQVGHERMLIRMIYSYLYDGMLDHHPSWLLSIENTWYPESPGDVLFAASINLSLPHAELTAQAKEGRWQFLVDMPGVWENFLNDVRD